MAGMGGLHNLQECIVCPGILVLEAVFDVPNVQDVSARQMIGVTFQAHTIASAQFSSGPETTHVQPPLKSLAGSSVHGQDLGACAGH